jgi:hypothetical protein
MRSDGVDDAQSFSDGAASPGRMMRLSTERDDFFGSSPAAGAPVLFGVSDMLTIDPIGRSTRALQKVGERAGQSNALRLARTAP